MARFGTPDDTRPQTRLDCRVIDVQTDPHGLKIRPPEAPGRSRRPHRRRARHENANQARAGPGMLKTRGRAGAANRNRGPGNRRSSGDGYLRGEVDVLDRVHELDALLRGTL